MRRTLFSFYVMWQKQHEQHVQSRNSSSTLFKTTRHPRHQFECASFELDFLLFCCFTSLNNTSTKTNMVDENKTFIPIFCRWRRFLCIALLRSYIVPCYSLSYVSRKMYEYKNVPLCIYISAWASCVLFVYCMLKANVVDVTMRLCILGLVLLKVRNLHLNM